MRRRVPVVLLALVMGTAAACGGDPESQHSPVGGATATPKSPAKHRAPAWKKKYSKAQVAAYREAKGRWQEYTRSSERIWEKGKATSAARELFTDFFYQPDVMYHLLESYEKRKVTVRGVPLVLHSRPTEVALDADPVTVVMKQCIDPRPVQMTAGRVPITDPEQTPVIRKITLSKVDGGPYQVLAYEGPETGDRKACR